MTREHLAIGTIGANIGVWIVAAILLATQPEGHQGPGLCARPARVVAEAPAR